MKRNEYRIRENIILKNKLTGESVHGNIVNERDIEGKSYWVLVNPSRLGSTLSYSKDSWSIVKGK